MKDKETLKSLELYTDKDKSGRNQYYLKAVYEHKTKFRKTECTIPKIYLPVNFGEPAFKIPIPHCRHIVDENFIDLGFGDLLMVRDKDNVIFTEKVIEEYPQKMTLSEIEKKLGHKVEIVSEKPDAK